MTTADPVRLIELAYRYVPDEREWLSDLVEASGAYGVGEGVVACTIDIAKKPKVRTMRTSDTAGAVAKPITSFVDRLSPTLAPAVLAPTEFVGNAAWRLKRLSTKAKGAPLPRGGGLPPMWALTAGDGARDALVLGFPCSAESFAPEREFPHRDRHVLGLVGAHLSAALRLRGAAKEILAEDQATEVVLAPSGRVLDARGVGKSPRARRSLAEAVVRNEHARGKLRRTDSSEATSLWQALVGGRWSILEIVERDGKRLLLARANPPASPDRIALTKGESDVVWLVALGHSFKYVSYELGLSTSTIVRKLNQAMVKLGVTTRRELLSKLGRPLPAEG